MKFTEIDDAYDKEIISTAVSEAVMEIETAVNPEPVMEGGTLVTTNSDGSENPLLYMIPMDAETVVPAFKLL